MARNFTRSSRGTVGSWASSSTRRLNSNQDSSRLTKASDGNGLMRRECRPAGPKRSNYAIVTKPGGVSHGMGRFGSHFP